MDIIITLVLLILFIIIMIFSFLLGILTKLIRKRDIGVVILIGIILGGIGGLVCITPISEDIPQFVGTCAQVFNGDNERLTVELRTDSDIDGNINALSQIGGVNNITNEGLVIHTGKFSDNISNTLEQNIMYMYPNISTWDINNNQGLIYINLSDGNFNKAAETLKGPLYDNFNITYSYSVVELSVDANADAVDHITTQLSNHDVVVTNIEGPVNSIMNYTATNMPSNQDLVIISAILGGLLSILGIFSDQIRRNIGYLRKKK